MNYSRQAAGHPMNSSAEREMNHQLDKVGCFLVGPCRDEPDETRQIKVFASASVRTIQAPTELGSFSHWLCFRYAIPPPIGSLWSLPVSSLWRLGAWSLHPYMLVIPSHMGCKIPKHSNPLSPFSSFGKHFYRVPVVCSLNQYAVVSNPYAP